MKISYRWLQEYVHTTLPAAVLGERFQLTSSPLEGLEDWSLKLKGLVAGQIEKIEAHPKADRLHLTTVNIGHSRPRHIVCGAPGLEVGQMVIVALPGTTLYPLKGEPILLSETIIRGEKSEGMLCAAEEIGLALPSEGLLFLDSNTTPGSSVAEVLNLQDSVLDLEITPNRPDLLSYVGLAREVAAFERRSLLEPPIYSLEEKESSKRLVVKVDIEDQNFGSRYSGICLDGFTVADSPLWLQLRLLLSDVQPVNNIVDIANYVMLELGQPLHTFDYDTLSGNADLKHIIISSAKGGERLHLLDGSMRALHNGDIILADENGVATDLVGIMGSSKTAISAKTSRIFIESATFTASRIRRTSRHLGIRTEASGRFEKGLDPELTVTALKRAIYLMQEICGAKVCSQLVDIYPSGRPDRPRIHVSFSEIQQLTGVHVSAAETKSILQKLGFGLHSLTKSSFEAVPPSWRADISIPEDVIEELLRIWGFERLPNTLPVGPIKAPELNTYFEEKQQIRRLLSGTGLYECIHLSLVSGAQLQLVGINPHHCVHVRNPLSREGEYLAPSHVIALLNNCATENISQKELALFEIGKIFVAPHDEREVLSILLRSDGNPEALYRQMKGILKALYALLQCSEPTEQPDQDTTLTFLQKESSLLHITDENVLSTFGLIDPAIISAHKIRSGRTLVFAQVDLELLHALKKFSKPYIPPPVYPVVERDIAIAVAETVPIQKIIDFLEGEIEKMLVTSWNVTDIYTGKPLPAEEKSVTLHFVYNSATGTLSDSEVNKDITRLTAGLKEHFQATIR